MSEDEKQVDKRDVNRAVEFAPVDYTDGRQLLDWQTKYPAPALRKILYESLYVGTIFAVFSVATLVLLFESDNILSVYSEPQKLLSHLYAWLGGTLGGTLFSIKWLYHSVAKKLWHADRLLWRVFSPHMSGAVSFFMILLIGSGVVQIFNPELVKNPSGVLGFAFLTGYFSDKALAKLAETADTLFGVTKKQQG